MKIVGKKKSGIAQALTNPNPQFVSLVTAGANLTPFAVTRSEGELAMAQPATRRRRMVSKTHFDQALEHPLASTAFRAEGVAIASMSFRKGEVFKSETDVKDWLDDGGYADYAVEATSMGWIIRNEAAQFDGDPSPISATPDVTVFVGKLKAAEEAAETESGKSEESTSEEVNPGANSGEESAPDQADTSKTEESAPAAPEQTAEQKSEDGQTLKTKSIYEVVNLAECIRSIGWLASDRAYTEQYQQLDSTISTRLKSLASEALTILSELATSEAAAVTQKSEELPKAAETTPEPVAEQTTAQKSEEVAAPVPATPDFAEIFRSMMAPVAETIGTLTKSVADLTSQMAVQKSETEERLAAVETRAQTRKGAGIDDTQTVATPKPAATTSRKSEDERFISNLSFRSAMGSQR